MRRVRWILGVVGAAWWVMRRRQRSRHDALSLPERTVERGKDAAGVVAETAVELTRPPGSEQP